MAENMSALIHNLKAEFAALTGLKCVGVAGVSAQDGNETVVTLEMLEKTRIPDSMDILGVYEVKINSDGSIKDFSRIRLRNRGETN